MKNMKHMKTAVAIFVVGVIILISIFFYYRNREKSISIKENKADSELTIKDEPKIIYVRSKENGKLEKIPENDFNSEVQAKVSEENLNNPPSERAVKAAAVLFAHIYKKDINDFIAKYASDEKDKQSALSNFAYFLDLNPEKLVLVETVIENSKIENNKVANYKSSNLSSCTSHKIGDFTYTDCF